MPPTHTWNAIFWAMFAMVTGWLTILDLSSAGKTETIPWNRPGTSSGRSVPSVAGNIDVSRDVTRTLPTKNISLACQNHGHRIQSMIYTSKWIERLRKNFRSVARTAGRVQWGLSHPIYGKDYYGQEVLPEVKFIESILAGNCSRTNKNIYW